MTTKITQSLSAPAYLETYTRVAPKAYMRTNGSPILSRAETKTEDAMSDQINKVSVIVSEKFHVLEDEDNEKEAYIQHFMQEYDLTREVAEARYDAFA